MEAKFWIDRWESGNIGFHRATVHEMLVQHAGALASLVESPRVLVPLCGKSHDMTYLREIGYGVVGVELCQIAARAYFEERGLTPDESDLGDGVTRLESDGVVILCGDILQLTPETIGPIHAAYDRAALIALPPELRTRYANMITKQLPHGAPVLLIGLDYPQEDMPGPPFSVGAGAVRDLFQKHFAIDVLERNDVLPTNVRFKGRVSHLYEEVIVMTRLA